MANTARITQSAVEVLTLQVGNARITQSAIELVVGLGINCGNPPNAVDGVSYSHAFPAGGGDPPYSFSIVAGALPGGLALNPLTGVVSGVPTAQGLFAFTVQVSDSLGSTATAPCSILVSGVPLSGLRIILRGVKRTRKGQEGEVCACPELPPVDRAV
jgi:large repetitive protein